MSDVWDISSADTPGGDMDIRTNSGVAPDIAGACVDGIDDGDTAEVVVAIELSKAAGRGCRGVPPFMPPVDIGDIEYGATEGTGIGMTRCARL